MYNIDSITVSEFVQDTSIELPRFQRKKVWKETQNFLLAVSIFKKYPIGVVIINKEKIRNRNNNIQEIKYLLDGRQRLNALTEMYTDPEQIYFWARKYIKFKGNDPESTVIKNTINGIKEYIDETANITNSSQDIESYDASNQEFDGYIEDESELQEEDDETLVNDLSLLLKLIKLAHNGNRGTSTGLTKKFDFSNYFQKISYIGDDDHKIISRDLKTFLIQYNLWCSQTRSDWEEKDVFIKYYEKLFTYKPNMQSNFKSYVDTFWNDLKESIHVFIDINDLFSNARIGTITTSNITATDAQKIFDVINTQGKHLTQAQVLSAKPAWNKEISNYCTDLFNETKQLYNKMQIDFNNKIVKWDVAATFVDRLLHSFSIFWNSFDDSESSAEKKIGYGFKILAGIFTDKVTQDGIIALSIKQDINWATDIDNLIHDLDTMYRIILEGKYFKYYSSWGRPMMKLISDYSAIDYTLVMYKYYIALGKPIGSQPNVKDFQKKAFILFDKLIYENLTGVWKGSADSKIARSLNGRLEDNFIPIESSKWESLLESILEDCKIGDNAITTHTTLEPLLYHYYCLDEKTKPSTLCSIDVDHIMPQSAFASSQLANRDKVINNIYNLALMPKKDNISKSDKRLNAITDQWLIDMIKDYENIKQDDFNKFSDINNYSDLKDLRAPLFINVIKNKRNSYLNN